MDEILSFRLEVIHKIHTVIPVGNVDNSVEKRDNGIFSVDEYWS